MKNINNSNIHGFTDSNLDGSIRARTIDGDIVTFNISDKGIEASVQDQKLAIPVEMSNMTSPTNLVQLLKVYTINVSDGKLKIAPIARTVDGDIVTFNVNDKEIEVMIKGQKLTAPVELSSASDLKSLFDVLLKNAYPLQIEWKSLNFHSLIFFL